MDYESVAPSYIVTVLKDGETHDGMVCKAGSKFVAYIAHNLCFWPFSTEPRNAWPPNMAPDFLPHEVDVDGDTRFQFVAGKSNEYFDWTMITHDNVKQVHSLVSDPNDLVTASQASYFLYGSAKKEFQQRAISLCIKGTRTFDHDAIVNKLIENPVLADDLDLDVKIDIVNKLALERRKEVDRSVTVFEIMEPEVVRAAEIIRAAKSVEELIRLMSERLNIRKNRKPQPKRGPKKQSCITRQLR